MKPVCVAVKSETRAVTDGERFERKVQEERETREANNKQTHTHTSKVQLKREEEEEEEEDEWRRRRFFSFSSCAFSQQMVKSREKQIDIQVAHIYVQCNPGYLV